MSGFFARLGEKAVGAQPTLTPVVTPLYGRMAAGPVGLRANQMTPRDGDEGGREELVEESAERAGGERDGSEPHGGRDASGAVALPAASDRFERDGVHVDSVERRRPDGMNRPALPQQATRNRFDAADHRDVAAADERVSPGGTREQAWDPRTATPADRDPFEPDRNESTFRVEPAPARNDSGSKSTLSSAERPARRPSAEASPRDVIDRSLELASTMARLRALGSATRSRQDPANDAALSPPVVRISIGRIEVRAAPSAAAPAARSTAAPAAASGPSLAEYLAKRPRSRE